MHEKLESLTGLNAATEQPASLTSERSFTGAASVDYPDGLGGDASGSAPKSHHSKVKGEKGNPVDIMNADAGLIFEC